MAALKGLFNRTPLAKGGDIELHTKDVAGDAVPVKKHGTFGGVFIPTCENMWGVVIFLRFGWCVGVGGVGDSLGAILFSFIVAVLTAASMCALITNREIAEHGGAYKTISQSLGPELGGAIGLCYWLGVTALAGLEMTGAVETFQAGGMFLIDCVTDRRLLGSLILFVMLLVAFFPKHLGKVGLFILAVVITTILSIQLGMLASKAGDHVEKSGKCYHGLGCDHEFIFPKEWYTGPNSDTLRNNWQSHYRVEVGPHAHAKQESFSSILVYIFACFTGMLAGSDRSTDLINPQHSIPIGMMGSLGLSAVIYSIFMILFGSVAHHGVLQCSEFIAGDVALPVKEVALIGISILSLGAGMQCLAGAPVILAGIAEDNLLPFSNYLKKREWSLVVTGLFAEAFILTDSLAILSIFVCMFYLLCYMFVNFSCFVMSAVDLPSWRPRYKYYHWSTALTGFFLCVAMMFAIEWFLALLAIGLATMAYVYMLYVASNMEWGVGLRGVILKLARSFLVKNMQHGRKFGHNTWRPQALCIASDETLGSDGRELLAVVSQLQTHTGGLCIVADLVVGDYLALANRSVVLESALLDRLAEQNVDGFAQVLISSSIVDAVTTIIQTAGIEGDLTPNTVMMQWPEKWTSNPSVLSGFFQAIKVSRAAKKTMLVVKTRAPSTFRVPKDTAILGRLAISAMTTQAPEGNRQKTFFTPETPGSADVAQLDRLISLNVAAHLGGTADIWMLQPVDDGLLLMLTFLLRRHQLWSRTRVRLFVLVSTQSDRTETQTLYSQHIYRLRIEAEVKAIPHKDASDIFEMFADQDAPLAGHTAEQYAQTWLSNLENLSEVISNTSHGAELLLLPLPTHMSHLSETTYADGIERLTRGSNRVIFGVPVHGLGYTTN